MPPAQLIRTKLSSYCRPVDQGTTKTLLLSAKVEVEDNTQPAALRRKYFISERDVYRTYLKIVQEVSKQLWTDESHIHEVEMLLFAIADSVAYESLFNSLAEQRK